MPTKDSERQWYELFTDLLLPPAECSETGQSTEDTEEDVEELLNDALGG